MSDLAADPDRQGGRSTTLVVVLALVFLTVLGASVGVILAKSNNEGTGSASPSFDAESSTPAQVTPGASKTAGNSTAGTGASGGSYPPVKMDVCPQQLKDKVGIPELTVVRAIQTSRSEVWICKAPNGKLFYQGHIRGEAFTAAFTANSICLGDVKPEGDVYVATNAAGDGRTTKYYVARDYLKIIENDVVKINETGTEHWGN
jgi:hypothetical protein